MKCKLQSPLLFSNSHYLRIVDTDVDTAMEVLKTNGITSEKYNSSQLNSMELAEAMINGFVEGNESIYEETTDVNINEEKVNIICKYRGEIAAEILPVAEDNLMIMGMGDLWYDIIDCLDNKFKGRPIREIQFLDKFEHDGSIKIMDGKVKISRF